MSYLFFKITNTGSASYKIFYRLKNTNDPWNGPFTVSATPGPFTEYTVDDVDPNEYEGYAIAVCANGTEADGSDTFDSNPICKAPSSMNAVAIGTDFRITYNVADSVPFIELLIEYPNGGSFSNVYPTDDSKTITEPQPPGIYGDFLFSIRSVCNQDSGWTSAYSSEVEVTVNNPSACPPVEIGAYDKIRIQAAADTYRFTLHNFTSSVRVVIQNNTTGAPQQILTQTVTNDYVDIDLPKGSIDYNYTVSMYNLCDQGIDNIGDSVPILVGSNAQIVTTAGWTVGVGPEDSDLNGDGVIGLRITVNTNSNSPSTSRDCLVIVRFNCTTSGYAYANVTIQAGESSGQTRDWASFCSVDTQSVYIESAQLI